MFAKKVSVIRHNNQAPIEIHFVWERPRVIWWPFNAARKLVFGKFRESSFYIHSRKELIRIEADMVYDTVGRRGSVLDDTHKLSKRQARKVQQSLLRLVFSSWGKPPEK